MQFRPSCLLLSLQNRKHCQFFSLFLIFGKSFLIVVTIGFEKEFGNKISQILMVTTLQKLKASSLIEF